jgi:histidinol-phosphatase
MNETQLWDILALAVEAAQRAGAATLAYFQADCSYELKPDGSPVTPADRAAEQRLRDCIEKFFPQHGILGEEFGEKPGSTPARWILDPIDGTVSFLSGVPLYSVLVGFEWEGDVLAGVIHLPALRETLYAARGLGCWWNGRRASVSQTRELSKARLSATSLQLFERTGRLGAYERLRAACLLDRGWPDAYGYACLATGRCEIMLDPVMHIWDNAALLPIVTEAGGTFTDWLGRPTHRAPEALATNGHLLPAVLDLLRGPAVPSDLRP